MYGRLFPPLNKIIVTVHLTIWIYITKCGFISHNCDFISHNCIVISHSLALYLQMWLYVLLFDFLFCNLNFFLFFFAAVTLYLSLHFIWNRLPYQWAGILMEDGCGSRSSLAPRKHFLDLFKDDTPDLMDYCIEKPHKLLSFWEQTKQKCISGSR